MKDRETITPADLAEVERLFRIITTEPNATPAYEMAKIQLASFAPPLARAYAEQRVAAIAAHEALDGHVDRQRDVGPDYSLAERIAMLVADTRTLLADSERELAEARAAIGTLEATVGEERTRAVKAEGERDALREKARGYLAAEGEAEIVRAARALRAELDKPSGASALDAWRALARALVERDNHSARVSYLRAHDCDGAADAKEADWPAIERQIADAHDALRALNIDPETEQ